MPCCTITVISAIWTMSKLRLKGMGLERCKLPPQSSGPAILCPLEAKVLCMVPHLTCSQTGVGAAHLHTLWPLAPISSHLRPHKVYHTQCWATSSPLLSAAASTCITSAAACITSVPPAHWAHWRGPWQSNLGHTQSHWEDLNVTVGRRHGCQD